MPLAVKRGTGPTGESGPLLHHCQKAGNPSLWWMLFRYRGTSVNGEGPDISLLEAFGNLFESPSSAVLIEASAALEAFAPLHKACALLLAPG